MAKIVDIKKYQKREKINKILLYCVDNKMETRYITAEFKKQNLLIRFTHFNHFKEDMNIDFIYDFTSKEANDFVKTLAKNKSDFLYKLQEMFNTPSACQDLIQYANNHSIEHQLIDGNNYDENEIMRYDFGDIYEDEDRLYYSNGELIIPTLYKHPKNGVMKIYLPSGYLYMEISYINNLKDGITKCYFPNSKQISWQQNYTKDKLDGITKNYLRNGQLLREETFVHGVKEGCENTYHPTEGYLEIQEIYANNKKNGQAFKYYPNGQIKHEAYFKNDKQEGITKQYYETGELELIGYWQNDKMNGLRVTYHKNGKIKSITTAKNNVYTEPEYQYYEDGTLEAIIPAYDTGVELVYYPNGKLKSERKYNKGKKFGNGKYYYDNGKIEADYNYKNNKRHGVCKEYHYSGKLRLEYEYKNGKKQGIEKRYYNNGQLSYEHSYKNGLRDGYSISYKEKTGEIEYKILFRKGKVVDFHGNNGITGIKNLDIEEALKG